MALMMVLCWSPAVATACTPLAATRTQAVLCKNSTEIQSRYLVILQSVKTAEVNFAVKEIKP